MAQVTLISGLTVPEEYLPTISQWASGAVDTQIDQSLPLGIKLVISLLGHAANREQDREFKLEMLQAGRILHAHPHGGLAPGVWGQHR